MLRLILLSLLGSCLCAPAQAATVDLRAGSLRDALAALSRQTGASIAVDDPALWRRAVPAVRGEMSVERAIARLLKGAPARVMAVPGGWRIAAVAPPRAAPRAAPAPVEAEDDSAIVVTASKRDVRLAAFAGSVTVLDGEDLTFTGERGTESILARLASLSSTHLGAGRNKLFVRGIADSSFTGPTQATVGQYLGDMRLTYNAPDPDLRLYDIRSVEVLEGPQGTLYGAGSLGGIIRIVRNPAELDRLGGSFSTGLSATQHGDIGGDVGGTLNIPLVEDKAALRVVGYGIEEGGYIDDVLRGENDINRTRIGGGRATLRVVPGDGWTVDLGGLFQENHGADSQYADRGLGDLERASTIDAGFDASYRLGEIVVQKHWGDLSFSSSTGLARQHLEERYDATIDPKQPRAFTQHNRTRMFATENRLWQPMRNGFGWVVGASYTRNRTTLTRALGPVDEPVPTTGVTNVIREATVYGEASVELAPRLTATAGARYAHARLSGHTEDAPAVVTTALRADGTTARRTASSLLPSAALSLDLGHGALVYARYQEGIRPGGLAIEADRVSRFQNDRVRSVEGGIRFGRGPRSAVYGAASLSYARWTDIQADYIDGAGLPSTSNIGDGRIWSLSAAIGWRPMPGLSFDASAIRNDSKVTSASAAFLRSIVNQLALVDPVGAVERADAPLGRVPNVARFSARLGFNYETALSDDVALRLSGWARYIGKSRLGVGPLLGEEQGDYADTALSARIGRPDFGVTVSATNLADAVGNRFALGSPFVTDARQITPLRPRTIRIAIDRAF